MDWKILKGHATQWIWAEPSGSHIILQALRFQGVTILVVYMDDIILIENDKKEKVILKKCIANEFEIKELDRLKYFLGIEVAHSNKEIFISQHKYITDLLK